MANHPIFAAAFHGKTVRVRAILKSDPESITARTAKNLTPLHVAASRGQHEVVQLLIDHGADVQGPSDKDDWTPLVYASYRGHYEAVRVLLENGAGTTTKHGNPIHYSGQRKHKEICRLLVEHGAIDGLIRSKDDDVLELFRAAYSYNSKKVDEILTARPKLVNRKDKNGRTMLHEACTQADTKTVRVLLRHGIDIGIVDKFGQTALERAVAHRAHAVAKLLRK